jgi:MGT family glycosyltransferase
MEFKKALFLNSSDAGHLNPMLDVVFFLKKWFPTQFVMCPAVGKVKIEAIGATWVPYMEDPSWDIHECSVTATKLMGLEPTDEQKIFMPMAVLPCTVGVLPSIIEFCNKFTPDVVFYDAAAPWGRALAQKSKIPCVCMMSCLPGFFDWKLDAPSRQAREILLSKFGVSMGENPYENYGNMNLMMQKKNWVNGLNFSFPEFAFCGPSVAFGPVPKNDDKNFLHDTEQKVILVSLGTIVTQKNILKAATSAQVEKFYQSLTEAFSNKPFLIIVAAGESIGLWEQIPANFQVVKEFPQRNLLSSGLVSLMVCHGGMNTVSECAYYGVPLVVHPFVGDQFGNAELVVNNKYGVKILADKMSSESLEQTCMEAIALPKPDASKKYDPSLVDALKLWGILSD